MSNKLMIFRSNRKNWRNAVVWQKKVMLEKNQGLRQEGGRREVEVGTLLLSNDENNVIAENVLSYF